MDAVAAGPPFDASPPHEEGPEKVVAGADFEGHGIAAIALGQLDGVGQICGDLGAGYATFSSHAVNRITGSTSAAGTGSRPGSEPQQDRQRA